MTRPGRVRYAAGTSWQPWQRDYRLGVILIVPPDDIREPIDRLRARYDPVSRATCPAHISVSDPLSREMTPQIEDALREVLGRIEPFRLHFDTLYASSAHPGVAYAVYPEEPVRAVQQALHATSAFSRVPYARRDIPPHMTVAEYISIEESLRLCAALRDDAPRGSFVCDRMDYIVPDDMFAFRSVTTFYLKRRP